MCQRINQCMRPLWRTRKSSHSYTTENRLIRYWLKLLIMDEHTLPKIVHSMLKNDLNNNMMYGGTNWAYQIKAILQTHGLGELWLKEDANSISFHTV